MFVHFDSLAGPAIMLAGGKPQARLILPEGSQVYAVVLVPSTSHAIRCEKILKRAGIQCRLVPVPRHLSSNCGLAVHFDWEQRGQVENVLQIQELDYDDIRALD